MKNKLAAELLGEENYSGLTNTIDFSKAITGKTTGEILSVISKALLNPNTKISTVIPSSYGNVTRQKEINYRVLETIRALGLRFYKLNSARNTLTFEIFEETRETMNIIEQITKALSKAIEEQKYELVEILSAAYQRVKSVETYSSQKEEKHIGAYSN